MPSQSNPYDDQIAVASQVQARVAAAARVAVLLLAGVAAMPGMAQDVGRESGGDAWRFSVSPYLWAAGIEGTTATLPGLPAAKVDMRFSDIVDDLKPSGMLFLTASKGRVGFAADLQYVQTEADSRALRPLFGRETLRSTNLVLSGLATYQLIDDGRARLRLGGGVRYWSVETDLRLAAGLLRARHIKSEESWLDPLIGASGTLDLSPRIFARGWAYVGGFGIGSDHTADLFAGLGYRLSKTITASLGYRWLKVDYEHRDFLYDVRQAGIASGLSFAF